jgi:hypothetical protein
MKLEAIESSQIAALLNVTRPAGQLYLPAAAAALVEKYSFVGTPQLSDFLDEEPLHFKHGSYQGAAFDFSIYNDGAILKSASDSQILEAALEEILGWAASELGLIQNDIPPRQRFFESAVVVSMDLAVRSTLLESINTSLNSYQKSYGLKEATFDLAGVSLAVDSTAYVGRKPAAFTLARRVNVPFNSPFYYSTAPLKTSDHLDLLRTIEKAWG